MLISDISIWYNKKIAFQNLMDDVYQALPVSFTLNERCVILRKCCKMCDECIL